MKSRFTGAVPEIPVSDIDALNTPPAMPDTATQPTIGAHRFS
jgi:hypothetical protein